MPDTASRKERVQRGIEVLDASQSLDWPFRITRHINLCNQYRCILGQVFPSFVDGLRALDLPKYPGGGELEELGFSCRNIPESLLLERQWRKSLRKLKRSRKSTI